MKTSGFTLVELLAVIVILSLLALLASTSVTKLIKGSKEDIYNIQLNSIKEAAETWGAENLLYLPNAGECKYLTVGVLKEYGLLDETLNDSRNHNPISDDLKIKITTTQGKYGTNITNYEVDSKNIEGCSKVKPPVCVAVTSSNATYRKDDTSQTLGKIPTGEYLPGDEYVCNVDGTNSYHFYILETVGYNVSLIMASNYDTTTQSWCASGNSSTCNADGLTSKLNEIKAKWKNINSDKIVLPTANQIAAAAGNPNWTGTSYYKLLSAPWLYDYLSNCYVDQVHPVEEVRGYWTSSIYNSSTAWYISCAGNLFNDTSVSNSTDYGVRPVIILTKKDFNLS